MQGHQSGKLLLVVSFVLLTSVEAVNAQIFVRQPHNDSQLPRPWCGMEGCPPKLETFGHFRENWRRWPGESSLATRDALSPFVTPDRDIPDSVVPDPRDEASQVQRRRTPVRSPDGSIAPAPENGLPDAGLPEPTTPAPGLDTGDLPNNLSEGTDGGAFPSGDLPADDVRDAFPGGDLPDDNLQEEPGLPGEEEEDIFNPDADDSLNELPGLIDGELDEYELDLGLKGPNRNQAQATPRPAADAPRQIDLVSAQSLEDEVHVHIRTASDRRNPLRRLKTRFATQRRPLAKPQTRQPRTQKVAPASYSRPVTATASPVPGKTSGTRRANPLR